MPGSTYRSRNARVGGELFNEFLDRGYWKDSDASMDEFNRRMFGLLEDADFGYRIEGIDMWVNTGLFSRLKAKEIMDYAVKIPGLTSGTEFWELMGAAKGNLPAKEVKEMEKIFRALPSLQDRFSREPNLANEMWAYVNETAVKRKKNNNCNTLLMDIGDGADDW